MWCSGDHADGPGGRTRWTDGFLVWSKELTVGEAEELSGGLLCTHYGGLMRGGPADERADMQSRYRSDGYVMKTGGRAGRRAER